MTEYIRSLAMMEAMTSGGIQEQRARKLHEMEKAHLYEAASKHQGHLVYKDDSDYHIFKILNTLVYVHAHCVEAGCLVCNLLDNHIVKQGPPDWYLELERQERQAHDASQ